LLSILMHPANSQAIRLVFAGPACCRDYFATLDRFLRQCLGDGEASHYRLRIGDPGQVAELMRESGEGVRAARRATSDAYYFNWSLRIDEAVQHPFVATHANTAALDRDPGLPGHQLAAQLRAAFSGIVAGNVKAFGIRQVAEHGPYRIHGDPALLAAIDGLLRIPVREKRMKLGPGGGEDRACYRVA